MHPEVTSAYRRLRVHIRDGLALNFDAALSWDVAWRSVEESYLAGLSFWW